LSVVRSPSKTNNENNIIENVEDVINKNVNYLKLRNVVPK